MRRRRVRHLPDALLIPHVQRQRERLAAQRFDFRLEFGARALRPPVCRLVMTRSAPGRPASARAMYCPKPAAGCR